jgi:hypothetical protein
MYALISFLSFKKYHYDRLKMKKGPSIDIKESKNKMTGKEINTEREIKEEANIRIVRKTFEALNSGDISRIHDYISPDYFNHESQVVPIRSKMRGPEGVYRYC